MLTSARLLLLSLLLPAVTAQALPLTPGEKTTSSIGTALFVNTTLTADADSAALQAADFKPLTQDVANFGIARQPVWLKLPVRNTSSTPGTWVLSLNRSLLRELKVVQVSGDTVTALMHNEDRLTSYASYGTIAAPFHLAGNESATIYLYYQGPNSSILPLSIETATSIDDRRLLRLILFFGSLAGVFTLVVYNGMLAVITRMPAFLYYSAAQSLLFIYFTHLSGITTVYIWPNNPSMGNTLAPVLAALTPIFNLLFVQSFVPRQFLPNWLWQFMNITMAIGAIYLVMLLATNLLDLSVGPPLIVSGLVTLATTIILPLSGVYACADGRMRFLPMTIAWFWFSICIIYTTIGFFDLVPVVPTFLESYMGFAFIEAVLLAVSLALAVRHIELERVATQASLADSLAAELAESRKAEQLMRERTIALNDLADRGRLLQAVGHDTRQALFALRQFTTGISGESEPQRIDTAKQSINQLINHLDDVLGTTLAGAHGGAMINQVISYEKISSHDLLEPIRLIYQRMASQKGLRLAVHPGSSQIVTDRVLMIRILSNLVSNAIKYTAAGGVVVACRSFGPVPRLQVWDTGSGLTPAQINRLLDDSAGSVRYETTGEGLGSGMQIVRSLAHDLDLTLDVQSVPGRGSVFTCVFPPLPTREGRLQCHLLDNDELTTSWLEAAGIAVIAALPDSSPLPLLIDIDHGGSANGISEARRLRDRFPNIILTTYDHAADIRDAAAAVSRYLAYKPLQAETLLTLWHRISKDR